MIKYISVPAPLLQAAPAAVCQLHSCKQRLQQWQGMGWHSWCLHKPPTRASQHALTGLAAAQRHIPGKFVACCTCEIVVKDSTEQIMKRRAVVTTMQATQLVPQHLLSPQETELT